VHPQAEIESQHHQPEAVEPDKDQMSKAQSELEELKRVMEQMVPK
jgi:hypothetical protein